MDDTTSPGRWLDYPSDPGVILRKKKAIKRSFNTTGFLEKRIAILGGSTTAEVTNILELFLLREGIAPVFYESQFNRFYEDAIFPSEALTAFKPDVVYIHTSSVNLLHAPEPADSAEVADQKYRAEVDRLTEVWNAIHRTHGCAVVQNNFELPAERPLGNLESSLPGGQAQYVARLNAALADRARSTPGFYVNDIHYLAARFGLDRWHDRGFWYSYKSALHYDAIPLLAASVASIVKAIFGKSRKCLVLDLDNTLWGGVIGDDGVHGIQLGTGSAAGQGHVAFQRYVKSLKQRGVTLAVCSKNETAAALEGLNHPETVLRADDFAVIKANWKPKDENIADIAAELNIGLDALVYVDDNPAERLIVSNRYPQIAVPDIGSDVTRYIEILDANGYFEPAALSQDDLNRDKFYQGNQQRKSEESKFGDYNEYLRSLSMTSRISGFASKDLERIHQLINKTNQFNLTTKRYSMPEVEAMGRDSRRIALYGNLVDRFGDNGIVTVAAGEIRGSELHMDLWIMSCRVIKRDLEAAVLDELVRKARAAGLTHIVGYYGKTAKNALVENHYGTLGFELVSRDDQGGSVWRLGLADAPLRNHVIEVSSD